LVSSGITALDPLLGDGYPDKSAILVVGPAGIGKEALRYQFVHSGLVQGDFCLYLTKSTPSEVLHDIRGFGVDMNRVPMWFAREGGEAKCDVNDLASLSFKLKEILKQNAGRRMRIATDVLSSLLVLNQMETVYRFLSQLFADIKQFDAVLVATLEEGMHDPKVVSTMAEIFDGVIEFKLYEEGLRVTPLLRVKKMRGSPPQPGYFSFSLSRGQMEISAYAR
jgi:KaiC/GvpD/RAD55 family RecA-like ATPase